MRPFKVKHLGTQADPYLDRTVILSTPWFGIYVHHIWREDRDYHPHDHPWPFVTLILSGEYVEEWHAVPTSCAAPVTVKRRRGSVHAVPLTVAHRIASVAPGTRSLVLRGRRKDDEWGFYVAVNDRDRVHSPWRDYLGIGGKVDTAWRAS